jgi:prolyl-tRNA editing enzyme YbaK/EbsC (Cys-tRNA(Pro) deacylase)
VGAAAASGTGGAGDGAAGAVGAGAAASATPGVRTIAEVCQLLGIEPAHTIKRLLYVGPSGPVLALVRGDQQLHEKKLARLLGGEARGARRRGP